MQVSKGQVSRSGQVTPPPTNFAIASRPQWLRERFETFIIWYTTKYLQLVYLRFFYISNLRSGQCRDLPIISQWENSNAPNAYQICSDRSESCSIRLLLMTSVQLCTCDSRKGHFRSNNDVMSSMYVFAYNF